MRHGWMAACAVSLALAGCGGGSGGISSAPTPSPAPTPTPSPAQALFQPTSSRTFVNESSIGTATFDLSKGTTVTATASPANLTINYDAAANSYTLNLSGLQQTFAPSDRTDRSPYQLFYGKAGSSSDDFFSVGGFSTPTTNSVGMGIWQHDGYSGDFQHMTLGAFVYGFPTAASEIPRSGSLVYSVGIAGVLSPPGATPRLTTGAADLTVDFQRSSFWLDGPLTSTNLLTGETISGGGLQLRASGHLTSAGTFSGSMSFDNIGKMVVGAINGRFFGASALEVGASFYGDNDDGTAFVGALSGISKVSSSPINLALNSLIKREVFNALVTTGIFQNLYVGSEIKTGYSVTTGNPWQFAIGPDQAIDAPAFSSTEGMIHATAANIVASPDPNFVRYEFDTLVAGTGPSSEHVTLDLFKPGPTNTKLALTYLSFGVRNGHVGTLPETLFNRDYFTYGIATPYGVLAGRIGSGHYEGTIRGTGSNYVTADRYEVSGTSRYDVDFTAQSYSGSLAMSGAVVNSSTVRDFGTFSFDGRLSNVGDPGTAYLKRDGRNYGEITSRFYGPDGDEIGSSFYVSYSTVADQSDATVLGGISVARRPGD